MKANNKLISIPANCHQSLKSLTFRVFRNVQGQALAITLH